MFENPGGARPPDPTADAHGYDVISVTSSLLQKPKPRHQKRHQTNVTRFFFIFGPS